MKKNYQKVMAFGTFDIFHKGHESFLTQAGKYGNFLVVVIARDKIVQKIKGKFPENSEKIRLKAVKNSRLADRVILGNLRDMYAAIKKEKPDVIALGYDQTAFISGLSDKLLEFGLGGAKIVRLRGYQVEKYKSSKMTNLRSSS